MNIDDKIKIQRIDSSAVDINGQRLSTKEALQYLQDLAQEFGQSLYTQDDIENAQEEGNESAWDNGYDAGFDAGHEEAKTSRRTIKQYSCARCNQTLSQEHIERLSNINKPRLNEFDHCNLVFALSDYNANCKK